MTSGNPEEVADVMWIAIYLIVTVTVAAAAFIAAEWFRQPGVPACDRPGCIALATGIVWPLLLVGVVQCSVIAVLAPRRRPEPAALPVGRPAAR